MSGRTLSIGVLGSRGVPATFGGIERHVEEIGSRLAARGHDVTVYCEATYVDDLDPSVTTHRGMRLVRVPTAPTKHLEAIAHSAQSTARAIGRRHDVVHYHAVGPGMLAPIPRFAGRARVVQTIHGLDADRDKWGGAAHLLLRAATWMSARIPDRTVVVSRALAEHYRQHYRRHTTYIPNGMPLRDHRPADEITERFSLQPDGYILFVGRLVPEKRPDALIRAFRQLDGEHRLVIAGDSSYSDDYVNELRHLAADDDRIIFTGYVYGTTLDELYTNASVFVLPSALEGLPLTLLEAIGSGTPVLASDIAPHREVLGDGVPGGRLFPSDDIDALHAGLRHAIDHAGDERHAASLLRQRTAEHYSWDAATEQLENVYLRATR